MKILVRLPNWLGDIVMSSAFIRQLTKTIPGCIIDVIIKEEFFSLTGCISGIRHVYSFSKKDFKGLSGAAKFGRKISQNESYDLFFTLPDSFSAALIGFFSGSKKRIGYSGQMRSFLLTSQYKKSASSHRVDQYIDLINHYFGSQSEETYRVSLSSAERADCALSDRSNKDNRIVLNVNSEASSRRLPLDKSVKIIDTLVKRFGYTIQLTGSSRDTVFTEQICKQVQTPEKIENLSGKTALFSLINVCNSARIIISTDSGIAHLANALNKPVIVLFGAGDDLNTSPYNKEMLHILRAPGIPCAPCVKNTCKYGHVNCMHRIDEKNIIDIVAKYQ